MYRGLNDLPKLRVYVIVSGSGAFCKPSKPVCKEWWRYQKRECWHERVSRPLRRGRKP